MRNKIIGFLFTSIFIATAAVLLPISITAQNGQLRYQSRYTKVQVGQTVRQLESSSNTFRHDFDEALDHSRINGSSREDQYNRLVKDYANSLDRLRKEFDRTDSWWLIRSYVSDTITKASAVNNIINNLSFRRDIERQWAAMRNDLNSLADTFDLPGLNGGGWNGGPWNGGNNGGWNGSGNMSSPPNWARGTFYATNGGADISLTLDSDGRVSAINNGQTFYGTYYRGNLLLNGDSSTVTQYGNNGIQTYNRNTGQTTYYSRYANNNPGGGGWNGGGNMSSPPSWARGTFYSTDGSNITLTLDSDGRATVLNNGQTFYGTYYRGNLLLNGDSSTLSQNGNGLRTYNRNTGQTTNYSRNRWNGGNTGGWNGSGNMSSPPSWAQGTFYSTNGTNISLTLSGNGQVTATVNGQVYYGTYYNGAITLNNDVSTVTRNGNGIRTYNSSNGQTTPYRRQ